MLLEELGDALLKGKGDIAGALTLITPARAEEFAYTSPIIDNIKEVIVTRKGGPAINSLKDLSGKEVYVVSGSAQMECMARLNDRLKNGGLKPVKVIRPNRVLCEPRKPSRNDSGRDDSRRRVTGRVCPSLEKGFQRFDHPR